jgi:hypothetical protein
LRHIEQSNLDTYQVATSTTLAMELAHFPKAERILIVLDNLCCVANMDRRIATQIDAWERQRNASGARIKWMFTPRSPRQNRPRLC